MTVDRKVRGWRHFRLGCRVLVLLLTLFHGFDGCPGLMHPSVILTEDSRA